MRAFSLFMKRPANRIRQASRHTADIKGHVFEGMDPGGGRMAFRTLEADRETAEHSYP